MLRHLSLLRKDLSFQGLLRLARLSGLDVLMWSVQHLAWLMQEEMEVLLGKACKQAISSLEHMSAELRAEPSQRVCGVPITRMLCPSLLQQLNATLALLETIPIILERTMQIGRENEFYFEVSRHCLEPS